MLLGIITTRTMKGYTTPHTTYLLYLRLRLYKALLENTTFDNRFDLNPTVKYTPLPTH